MALKCDLDVVYTCYRHENTSKEFQEYISNNFWCVRPLPADSGHILHQQKSKKSRKIIKKAIFQKSIFCDIVAKNMIFGRKLALWTPESPQKAYIDHPTWYGYILKKVKKIAFFTSKISIKIFFRPIILADVVRPPNRYRGSIHPIPAPKPL